ncbi:MAG: TIGR04211 family SH3 domain-containing protein, partial [Pseudomonadota bacterium]|nr:TIGR04211 family SH3 domain-containing protein [Pseudomonadota bacterium]
LLPVGTQVRVQRSDAGSGYSLVRVDGGRQGWILTRYLTGQPVAAHQLHATRQALEAAKAENANLKTLFSSGALGSEALDVSYQTLSQEYHRLNQELAQIRKVASNVVAIDEQNKTLQERVVELERELQVAQQENRSLAERSTRGWFLMGAGVLLAGVVLGLLLPRLSRPRRSRWGEL